MLLGEDPALANLRGEREVFSGVSPIGPAPLRGGADLLETLVIPAPGMAEDSVSSIDIETSGEVVQSGTAGTK